MRDFAARLNMTASAVATRTHRALEKLREQFMEALI